MKSNHVLRGVPCRVALSCLFFVSGPLLGKEVLRAGEEDAPRGSTLPHPRPLPQRSQGERYKFQVSRALVFVVVVVDVVVVVVAANPGVARYLSRVRIYCIVSWHHTLRASSWYLPHVGSELS